MGSLHSAIESAIRDHLDAQERSGDGEIVDLARHLILAGGKRLRPMLTVLCYEAMGGRSLDRIMPAAIASEFIHTATLVHDDINDAAKVRRGVLTLHEVAGPAKAIIVGDWLFVQGFRLSAGYGDAIIEEVSRSCADIAVSEIKQIDHIMDLTTSPEDYYEIVQGKTAGPFRMASRVAAHVADAPASFVDAVTTFGLEVGLAFQLVDDLLDITGDAGIGKPRGADVIEGKMTMPLIHALTLLHGEDRASLLDVIHRYDEGRLPELVALLERSGSIRYAELLVRNHLDRATEALDALPKSEATTVLRHVCDTMRFRRI